MLDFSPIKTPHCAFLIKQDYSTQLKKSQEEVDSNWIHDKLPPSLVMSMSMLKSGSFQMTQTPEPLMPLPPQNIAGSNQTSNRNSFLQGASLDYKLAMLRNEMVIFLRFFLISHNVIEF